jgi:uncharacterized protein
MNNASAFFQAICTGELEAVAACLQNSPTLLQAKDEGATPLHFAAINNYRDIVDLLLANGADLEAIDDEYGMTPLGWANEKGHVEMARYLFERGTPVNLNLAAACGLLDRVRELLAAQAPVNQINGFGAPMHEAAVWGQPEIARLLLAHGADPALPNRDGQTPLAIARQQVETNGQGTPIVLPERRVEIIKGCAAIIEILQS